MKEPRPSGLRSILKLVAATAFRLLLASATQAQQDLNCSSEDGKRHYCPAGTRFGVDLIRQRSGSPCTKDYSRGFDDRGIWVDRGCRAEFVARRHRREHDRDRDDHSESNYNNSGTFADRTILATNSSA